MAGDLYITGDPGADRLLNRDGTALLIGMLLDQQVPMEWAFAGPATLRARLGHIDAKRIVAMTPDELVAVCCEKPAIHRFPAVMARRIHALCVALTDGYRGKAERIWRDPADGDELYRRLRTLPGFGDEKARIFVALLAKRFGVRPAGWAVAAGAFADAQPRTIADIHDPASLAAVREWKRAQKAAGKDKQDRTLPSPTAARSGSGADTTIRVDAMAQAAFVDLSGDANPMHTDPLAARRLPFGRVAVHGMHLALSVVDHLAAAGATPARVRATFRHPVGIDDDVDVQVVRGSSLACRLSVDGRLVADITADVSVDSGDSSDTVADARSMAPLPPVGDPADVPVGEIAGRAGSIPVAGDATAIASRFPHLPVVTVAELLAVTRLVGMHVPGLRSLLSSFDVTIEASSGPRSRTASSSLAYSVETVDDRFSKVVLRIDGPTVHGTVTVFVRPEPDDPLVDTTIVSPGEFAGVAALVVGGSRGLGAAAVQLLAAGGADVRFTYHRGVAEAARVATAARGSSAHQLDVADATGFDAILDGWLPTFLGWFASPPIFVGARDGYSPSLFERFRAVYVDAFVHTIERVGPERLTAILWPSSAAVTDEIPGLAEYADAKRAGEQACADLAAAHPHLTVHAPRLPRMRTDQTASFVPVEAADPGPHVLAALRVCAGRPADRHLH